MFLLNFIFSRFLAYNESELADQNNETQKFNFYPKIAIREYCLNIIIRMHTTKNIQKFRENELSKGISSSGSWHKDYNSAYIFIGNLNYGMNEGDIVVVFSQMGEITDVRLVRDRETGKSRGFAFLAYQDQRSTDLAVDNFNGTEICGRVLRVDHVKRYNPPKQFLEIRDGQDAKDYRPTGPDGRGWGKFREKTEQQKVKQQQYRLDKQRKTQLLKRQIGLQ